MSDTGVPKAKDRGEAYRLGYSAYIAGSHGCPFPLTSPFHSAWNSGWLDAEADLKDVREEEQRQRTLKHDTVETQADFGRGREAFGIGRAITDGPYVHGSVREARWQRGWLEAWGEKQGFVKAARPVAD